MRVRTLARKRKETTSGISHPAAGVPYSEARRRNSKLVLPAVTAACIAPPPARRRLLRHPPRRSRLPGMPEPTQCRRPMRCPSATWVVRRCQRPPLRLPPRDRRCSRCNKPPVGLRLPPPAFRPLLPYLRRLTGRPQCERADCQVFFAAKFQDNVRASRIKAISARDATVNT